MIIDGKQEVFKGFTKTVLMQVKVTGLIFFFLVVNSTLGQDLALPGPLPKNEFMVRRLVHDCIDGGPAIQPFAKHDYGVFLNSIGFGYQRLINQKNYISATTDFYRYMNYGGSYDTGSTLRRNFIDYRLNCSRVLGAGDWCTTFIDLGISVRRGSETLLGSYAKLTNGFEQFYTLIHVLNDIGLSAGITFNGIPRQFIQFHWQLKYTRYVISEGKANPYYNWDNGPSKNMISFGFILGTGHGKGTVERPHITITTVE